MIGRLRALAHRNDHPDPAALAAGLTAEHVGRRWVYGDPILRAHLRDRSAEPEWSTPTLTEIREAACPPRVSSAVSSQDDLWTGADEPMPPSYVPATGY